MEPATQPLRPKRTLGSVLDHLRAIDSFGCPCSTDGAFFLRADGSVHFIKDSIDMKTYRALSTIQGGDIAVLD